MWLETLRRRWLGKSKSYQKDQRGRHRNLTHLRLEALEDRTLPSNIPVTIFTDSNVAGAGSLRDAILQANADTGTATDIIQLQAGTYSLTLQSSGGRANNAQTGALNINNTVHTLIIEGQDSTGANATIIDAKQLNDRVFQIASGVTVEFQNLEITGGLAQDNGTMAATPGSTDAQGGGILNQGGNVLLSNVAVRSNQAIGNNGHNGLGGGIFSTGGTVTLNNDSVLSNTAQGASGATGAANSHGGTGGSGGPGATAQGGGLYGGGGAISLNNVTFAGNTAQGGGGGQGGRAFWVVGSGFESPGGIGGVGGNGGAGEGGGVYAAAGTISVSNATFTNDHALGGGGNLGGAASTSGNGGQGGLAEGGALAVAGAVATLDRDVFSGDAAQGGGGGQGVGNSQGNLAGAGGLAGAAQGGGLYSNSFRVILNADTFSDDTAQGGNGGQGGLAFSPANTRGLGGAGGNGSSGQGGGVYAAGGTLSVSTTTFMDDTAQAGDGGAGGSGINASGQGGVGAMAQGGALVATAFTLDLTGDTFSGNSARGGAGGAGGFAFISASAGGNGGDAQGGGVETASNLVTSSENSFLNNTAAGGQGGHGSGPDYASRGGVGGTGQGGGLFVARGTVTSTNDALSGNDALGASGGQGGQGSFGGMGGSGGNGQGGGLFTAEGNVALTYDTLASNSAQGGAGALGGFGVSLYSGDGGNGGSGQGGGVYGGGGTVTLTDDALSANTAQGAAGAAGPTEHVGATGIGLGGNGGAGQGGAVAALGSVTVLDGDTVSGNSAEGGNGGQGMEANPYGEDGGNAGDGQGGGVFAESNTVTLTGVTLVGNSAHGGLAGNGGNGGSFAGSPGTAGNGLGGGLSSAGATVFLTNDTITGNSVVGGKGGNGASASAYGTGGSAGGDGLGGGISITAGSLTLTNDTIAGNSTTGSVGGGAGFGFLHSGPPGAAGSGLGGGFANAGSTSVTVKNTLIAQNTGSDYAGTVTTSDHNLIGNSADSSGFSAANGDILNPSSVGLGALANNGGPTQTMALLAGSPASGAADANVAPVADQRGVSRTVNTPADIGAYQMQPFATVPASRIVTPTTHTDSASSTSGSLRAAVIAANNDTGAAPITIQLAAGTYNLTVKNTAGQENGAQQGDLDITNTGHTLIIKGQGTTGANATVINASQLNDRVFQVGSGVTVELQNLVIEGGQAMDDGAPDAMPGSTDSLGGGLLNLGGTVSLTNVAVRSNRVFGGLGHNSLGGGIYNSAGTLHVTNSTISDNFVQGGSGIAGVATSQGIAGGEGGSGGSGQGGGLFAANGTVTLTGDSVVANEVEGGEGGRGGPGSRGGLGGNGGTAAGGALAETSAVLSLLGDTLSTNEAVGGQAGQAGTGTFAAGFTGFGGAGQGGGLYTGGGVVNLVNDTLTLNTTQAGTGPHAKSQGGAIDSFAGALMLTNTTIADNSSGLGGGVQNASNSAFALVSLQNTLIAQNTAATGPDFNGIVQVSDHNLIGNTSGSSGFSAANGDILNPASVGLGTLANNGGPTQTLALQPGSPAIDTGDDAALTTIAAAEGVTVANATDQTGHGRLFGTDHGLGAVEYHPVATTLVFLKQPASTTAGKTLATVQVEVLDQFGKLLATDNSDKVTLSGATFASGTTTATVVNGIATFSNLVIDKASTYKLTATSGKLSVSSTAFTINPAAPATLKFLIEPSTVTAGKAISPAVKVELLDPFGNVATNSNASVTMALATNPTGATLGGTTTVHAVNGVATFSNLTITVAGSGYTLKVAEGTLSITSTAFNVTAAAPAGVDIHGQPSDTVAGQEISPAVWVAVVDSYGNFVTSNNTQLVTLSIATGPQGATLGGTTTVRAHDGIATFGNLSLNLAGTYTLRATGGILTPDFSNAFTVAPFDVSAEVSIQFGKLHPAGHGLPNVYEQTLTLTNISGGSLSGPLALLLKGLPKDVVFANATGSYQGNPYLDVQSLGANLASGQSLTITLQFSLVGPGHWHPHDLRYATEVLQGI